MIDIARENNIEVLREACRAYDKAVRQLLVKVEDLAGQVADLRGVDTSQIGLELPAVRHVIGSTAPETAPKPSSTASRPARPELPGHGPTAQPELPLVIADYHFERPPGCSSCGGTMEVWTGQYEQSEEITVSEAIYRISLNRRQKYRCRCNAQVTTAPGPPKLIPGGRYSVDFAIHSAIAKFCDHMPLERQVRQMGRQQLVVTSQTLWDQQAALAKHLEPTWLALCEKALREPVLHADETGWRMMDGDATKKWTLFGLTAPGVAAYHLVASKSTSSIHQILRGFQGTLVVDGYAVYPLVAELEKRRIRIAHCWAHADRKLKEAKDPPGPIAEARGLIAELYELERSIPGSFPGDAATQARRRALRRERSAEVTRQIREWAFAQGGLRRSSFGKAVRYLLEHWDGLTLFLDDSRIPLDNNAAERILRGPVVGRKNYYGNRSRHGAKVAAILYSLIETAKLASVNPSAYLRIAAHRAIGSPGTVTFPT